VPEDDGVPLASCWDRSLHAATRSSSLFIQGYSSTLQAALWCENCITLKAANWLDMEDSCLQCIPEDARRVFLDAVAAAVAAETGET
jgi:hypothetical protein